VFLEIINRYSLKALTKHFFGEDEGLVKQSMLDLFGVPNKLKDGSDGKIKELPPLDEIQTNSELLDGWIEYSVKDSICTWHLREKLEEALKSMSWNIQQEQELYLSRGMEEGAELDNRNLFHLYEKYFVPFGKILTDMEKIGIKVDAENYLASIELKAREERKSHEKVFYEWASRYTPDAQLMNLSSSLQLRSLLFGEFDKKRRISSTLEVSIDKSEEEIAKDVAEIESKSPYLLMTVDKLGDLCKEKGIKKSGTKAEKLLRLIEFDHNEERWEGMSDDEVKEQYSNKGFSNVVDELSRGEMIEALREDAQFISEMLEEMKETPSMIGKVDKKKTFTIQSINFNPSSFTKGGQPMVSLDVVKKLAGDFSNPDAPKFGEAFDHFGGGEEGVEACIALNSLSQLSSIETMISTFLVPLQVDN